MLAPYDPTLACRVSADASSFCRGAIIQQKQTSGEWRPVSYQSRSMTATEQRYSQIEKEALVITWACERFSHYILGTTFSILTDHKPLYPLLSTKALDELPPRILRFIRLRLVRYHFTIQHIPGKELITADTLSRSTTSSSSPDDQAFQADVAAYMAAVTDDLPAGDDRLTEFRVRQAEEDTCSANASYCQNGWPNKHSLADSLKPYWQHRGDFTTNHDDLLLYGPRIVVPASMRLQVLEH